MTSDVLVAPAPAAPAGAATAAATAAEAIDMPLLAHQHGEAGTARFRLPADRNLFTTHTPVLRAPDPCGAPTAAAAVKAKAEEIRRYVHCTFEIYEKVFECLASREAFTVPPVHRLRHPLIFYYGHTATFYINKLVVAGLTTRINPAFEEMFAVGVDEMSWDDLNEAHYSWPSVEAVSEYRQQVRARLDELMTSGKFALNLPLTFADSTATADNAFWWVMLMGSEHERIHLETASVHVRELPLRFVRREMSRFWVHCDEADERAPLNEMVEVAAGSVALGRPLDSPAYGWDSDYAAPLTATPVAAFKASRYLVSNAEFFAFMKADGYKTRRFWCEEGWAWVTYKKPEHPWFWVKDASRPSGYALRLQTEEIALPWNWPVELNHLEAQAFVRFKSETAGRTLRLPTEAEWMLLRDRYVPEDQFEWKRAPGNINLEHFASSCPVDKFAQGPFFDIVGNVWQHCETPVYPYKGYRVHPFYDDFSLPTFDGRHSVMKGGAWISTGNEATRDARFAFRRHFFQCIGVRYIEGEPVSEADHLRNVLGLDPEVDAVTDFAFRPSFGPVPNACVVVANLAAKVFADHARVPPRRALDLACGAGRVTFELAATFEETVGSDLTARRLIPAFSMRERAQAGYSVVVDASGRREARSVVASSFPWAETRERAFFIQADAANLHAHMTNFDLIVAWNILERTYAPRAVPAHLLSRLNAGGVLLIGGTFEFDETVSPRASWIGGADTAAQAAELLALLGGESTVDVLDAPRDVVAAFPSSERSARLSTVTFFAFRKK